MMRNRREQVLTQNSLCKIFVLSKFSLSWEG